MKYFIVLRAAYLMAYYYILSKRLSKSYVLAVMLACISGVIFLFFSVVVIIFGRKGAQAQFPFEALLFHGLSYEEWRTARVVKEKMDRVQTITSGETNTPEDLYLVLLLLLSFSGLVERRLETPEERTNTLLGQLPLEGQILTMYTYDSEGVNIEGAPTKMVVSKEEAEIFVSMKRAHTESVKDSYYQGKTLSRLIHNGVRLVFLRKKLGPKRPFKTNAFASAFGIRAHES